MVAHNPLQVMVDILAALHDGQGRVTVPGFYDRVQPLSQAEKQAMRRIPFDEKRFLREEVGAPALWSGEAGYSPLERIGARPTLEIHGIRGGYVGPGQKTVIPARASAKVSMRLVPDQEPEEIARLFAAYVHELAPKTVEVDVKIHSMAAAAVMDPMEPVMQHAVEAIGRSFGAEPVFLRGGGTLPIVADFLRILDVPVVLMGFGLPDDNLHSPNEKFSVDHFYRGVDSAIYFLDTMGSGTK
jgi:acetylornithine deacetylase/succinyl-diaminopimelate desuccinylase-like protein